ncbi:MAG TPA: hypothetical protein VLH38_05005 [Patescibacteria group bacterium]|nr:hypothetical protein [Patescibacteria group bacterium]
MKKKANNSLAPISWLLRIGLALVFIYASIASLQHPLQWAGFLPHFLTAKIDGAMLIKIFAVYEAVLALWLLSGKMLRYCGALCALTLTGILITSPGQLFTTFRDIGLVFMALALWFVDIDSHESSR